MDQSADQSFTEISALFSIGLKGKQLYCWLALEFKPLLHNLHLPLQHVCLDKDIVGGHQHLSWTKKTHYLEIGHLQITTVL